jgi:glutaminyl-tRNA synthetase
VYEFSRLNVTTSLLSKRKVLAMYKKAIIRGWDDPRVMTLAGLRRRGYTPEGIRSFCDDVGVTRSYNQIPVERLEQSLRVDLDERCDRAFCVLDPLKVTISNFEPDRVIYVDAPNHPKHDRGMRKLPFSKVLYIEKTDFREKDEKDYYGLAPGKEVGLRFGFNITCDEVIKNNDGEVVELICSVDLDKKRKPKAHIHWLAEPAKGQEPLRAEVRLYNTLFTVDTPDASGDDYEKFINTESEKVCPNAFIDPIFNDPEKCKHFAKYQFERQGYFCVDTDSKPGALVFNRSVTLKVDKVLQHFLKN